MRWYFVGSNIVLWNSRSFTGALSIDFFEHFNGNNIDIGGPEEFKTEEILMNT